MTLTLQDPQSGSLVHITHAELPQKCRFCGKQLIGEWVFSVEGSSWVCLEHAPRVLMDQPISALFRARAAAREQMRGAAPGDQIVATGTLMAALGL